MGSEEADELIATSAAAATGSRRRRAPTDHSHNNREQQRKLRRELRPEKDAARRALKDTWKKAKKDYKNFKKKIRGARFKSKILPKIVKMVAPSITKEMNSIFGGKPIALDAYKVIEAIESGSFKTDVKAFGEAEAKKAQATLQKYVQAELQKFVSAGLDPVFTDIENLLWKAVDPIVKTLQNALVGSVGDIPFIGGELADVIMDVFEIIDAKVKNGVDGKIQGVETMLENRIVGALMHLAFKVEKGVLTFVKDEAEKGKDTEAQASSSVVDTASSSYASQNADAASAAPSVDDINADGQSESDDQTSEDDADNETEDTENSADNSDDPSLTGDEL